MRKEPSEHSFLSLSHEISIPKAALSQEKLLGEGGFGKVYLGSWRHTALHKTHVAIKQLHQANFSTRVLKEFEAEVTVQSRLEFPNIVKLYGITLEEPYCMVMELMSNGPLDRFLQQYDPSNITWNFRIQLAHDIARGLDYLHSQAPPIIHADLKSLNVLLDTQNRAKLSDFGLSSIKNETATKVQSVNRQGEGRASGSLLWMAPELLRRGGEPSLYSDVYAYGMVLWEITTHQYPFPKDAVKGEQIIREYIKEGDLDPFPEGTPEGYQALGEACRSKEKDKRPSTQKILELLGVSGGQAAVGELVSGHGPSAPPAYLLSSQPILGSENSGNPYLFQTVAAPIPNISEKAVNPYLLQSEKPTPAKTSPRFQMGQGRINRLSQEYEEKEKLYPDRETQVERDKRSQKALMAKKQEESLKRMNWSQRVNQKSQEALIGLNAQEVHEFLNHVMRGSLDGVERCLQRNQKFIWVLGDIKDCSDRVFKQVTGFQYAYWALDVEMCNLLLRFLPEESARDQILALEQERTDIVQTHGSHFNLEIYLIALKKYLDNFEEWNKNARKGGKAAMAKCWSMEVGGAQRGFPAWLIFMFSERGHNLSWVNVMTNNSFKEFHRDEINFDSWFVYKTTHVLGAEPNTSKWMDDPGCGFAWVKGGGKGRHPVPSTNWVWVWDYNTRAINDYTIAPKVEAIRRHAIESLRSKLCESNNSQLLDPSPNFSH